MRILMVAARFPPFAGGIETHVKEVSRRMAARGHLVSVLTADPTGDLAPREHIEGVDVMRVRAKPRGKDWCFAPDILRYVETTSRARQWDVVHVQGYHTFSAPFAMLGALRGSVPFVLTFHSGGHSSRFRNALRSPQAVALAPLARRAAALVGVSKYEADRFSSAMRIERERFQVVPNGASLPSLKSCAAFDAGTDPLILSLGRLEKYKGHHRVISAFAYLRKTLPNARLRVVGDGPYEAQLRRAAARSGASEGIKIGGVPPADREKMASLISEASLVVLLSEYEAHPIAVMEALSLGRPVLAAHTSGFYELAEAGLIKTVALDSSSQVVAATMAKELASGDLKRSAILPDWDDCADQLLSIYQGVRLESVR